MIFQADTVMVVIQDFSIWKFGQAVSPTYISSVWS